jgi:hypothetical protein
MNLYPKKTGRSEIERPVLRKQRISVAPVIALVTGIAVSTADDSATGSSDRGSFECFSGLMPDDSAEKCSA